MCSAKKSRKTEFSMSQVSVVIPTLRRADLVMRAVRSALSQTLTDLEVLVVVDGRDEVTTAALDRIDDVRFRYIVNPASMGAGPARDRGADEATGDWVAFLDDDDEWLPEKLERQMALAPASGKAILSTLYRVVSASGARICPKYPYDGTQPLDEWLFGRRTWLQGQEAMLQTSSLVFPREMFKTLRFRDTRQHEDWELCLRAVKEHGYALLTVPEPLVVYYTPQKAPSLSRSFTFEGSLDWANSVGKLLTPRGYSGFLLKVAWQQASAKPRMAVIAQALRAAFQRGRPSAKQLFAFFAMVLVPPKLRERARFRCPQ